ncbi:hypothetical protein RhiJN_10074 [Ceratobasidium sp. AG-Ba]|nr:hypothetical protein RhiJN_10074 [Ceratobasidium sp. AG-Ba]
MEFDDLLLKRSRDCPIHVHIYEYEVLEDRDDDEANEIIMALMPHIHRVSSLSIKLESEPPITSILTAWLEHGSENLAKQLSIDSPRNSIPFYYIPGTIDVSGKRENMLRSADILHLGYIDFGGDSSVYRNLTDLRLMNKMSDHDNAIWLPHLYDILHKNPRLVTLKLVWLTVVPDEEWAQPPRITFDHLRVLGLDHKRPGDLKHVLSLIALPDSPNELSIGISIDTREAVDMITEFLGHKSPSILPQTLVLAQENLEEVLPDASRLMLPEEPILGSIPDLVLYGCIVSGDTVKCLVALYNFEALWLDTSATITDDEDMADIQIVLSERYPELKWHSTNTFPEGPDPCRPILDMFD